jgi:predicted kinase
MILVELWNLTFENEPSRNRDSNVKFAPLETDESAVRFTHDEWMRSLYGKDPPEARYAEYAQRISDLMETMWTRCVALKTNAVLDFGFWSRRERDRVRELVASLHGEARMYRLSCPDDLAWSRVEKRNERSEAGLYIARNTFEVLKSRYEPLGPDEDGIEVG